MKRLLGVASLLALLGSPVSAQTPIEVTVAITAHLAEPPAEVEVSVTDGEGMTSVRPVALEGGRGRFRLALPEDARWTVSVDAPGVWSPPVAVTPAADRLSRTHHLDLWPALPLEARLRVPLDAKAPEDVTLRLVSPEITSLQPETARVTCPVAETRLADCVVPAGTWDLRLDFGGEMAPHMLWEQTLRGPEPASLGTVTLRRGGSLAGSLVTEGGPFDPEATRVWVEPVTRPLGDGAGGRAEQLRHPATVDDRGRFQIVGIPAGSYTLYAEHPGYVPAEMKPLAVERGVWSDLPPLTLERPVQLEVRVEPAVDVTESPWNVELLFFQGSAVDSRSYDGATDSDGRWVSPPIPPGPYSLSIFDQQFSRFHFEELTVAPGAEQVTVEIPLVSVDGEVMLGDEPVTGTVVFGGMGSSESIRVTSDDAGEFFLVLPRPGAWVVDVLAGEILSTGLEVDVRPFGDDRAARARVEIPDTRLSGRVVTVDGEPVPKPEVFALPPDQPMALTRAVSQADGTFVVRGLAAEVYQVEARRGDASSGPVTVDVREGEEAVLELVVRSGRPVIGQVTYDGAPVAGAWITAVPLADTGTAVGTGRTGLDGRFETTAVHAPTVRLIVEAPGHPLTLLEVAADRPVEVPLRRGAGTLVIEGIDSFGLSGEIVGLVVVDGQVIDHFSLARWASRQGQSLDRDTWPIPGMPPGPVALCTVTLREALLVSSGSAAPRSEACAEGYLSVGGELRLRAPEQAKPGDGQAG